MGDGHELSVWDRFHKSLNELATSRTRKNDPQVIADRLTKRAQVLRARVDASTTSEIPLSFLAIHKGTERYGIPIGDVLEVLTLDQFTAVPQAPAFLPGIVHWRGSILALFDLGVFFGFAETGIADKHACVIVEAANRRIALITGEVDDLLSVSRSQLKPAPDLPGDLPSEWILGVHEQSRLILRLDLILQHPRLEDWKR